MSDSIRISEARKLFARNKSGGLIHMNTIYNYANEGMRVGKRIVKLRTEREGRLIVTRPEWVREFIDGCSEQWTETAEVTPRLMGRSAAERFLAAEGM